MDIIFNAIRKQVINFGSSGEQAFDTIPSPWWKWPAQDGCSRRGLAAGTDRQGALEPQEVRGLEGESAESWAATQ